MIQKLTHYINKHHKAISIIVAVFVLLTFVNQSYAQSFWSVLDFKQSLISLVQDLTQMIINLLGHILLFLISFLVDIATFNNFGGNAGINAGWATVRDISNLLIVLGLLYVAFRSVTGESQYKLSSNLSKLVGIAILVNFSKTITLLAIDVSQVVMLTFVKAFANVGGGNLYDILKIKSFFTQSSNPNLGVTSAIAGMLFVVILMLIVIAVIGVMMLTLMARIVALWILIALSPIAIAGFALPVKKLAGVKDKWVSELTNWLMIGPLLAFFIWLTFTTLQGADNALLTQAQIIAGETATKASGDLSAVGTYGQFSGFILAVVMLLYGLKYTVEISGNAGAFTGKLVSKIDDYKGRAQAGAWRMAKGAIPMTGRFASDVAIGASRRRGLATKNLEEKYKKQVEGGKELNWAQKANLSLNRALAKSQSKTIEIAKGGAEFIQKSNPKRLAGAIYKRGVLAEEGAVGSALTESQQELVDAKVKDIESAGRGVDQSKKIKEGAAGSGRYADLTLTELMAEMKVALKNGAVQSDSDFLEWEQLLKNKGGANNEYVLEQSAAMRKEFFKDDSIYKGSEINEADTLEKIKEVTRSLDERDIFAKTNVRELDTQGLVAQSEDGKIEFKDEASKNIFNRKKERMLSYSESSVAQNNSTESKTALRKHLMTLQESGMVTSDEDQKKIQRLIAATYMKSKQAKESSDLSGDIDTMLQGNLAQLDSKGKPITTTDQNDLKVELKYKDPMQEAKKERLDVLIKKGKPVYEKSRSDLKEKLKKAIQSHVENKENPPINKNTLQEITVKFINDNAGQFNKNIGTKENFEADAPKLINEILKENKIELEVDSTQSPSAQIDATQAPVEIDMTDNSVKTDKVEIGEGEDEIKVNVVEDVKPKTTRSKPSRRLTEKEKQDRKNNNDNDEEQ